MPNVADNLNYAKTYNGRDVIFVGNSECLPTSHAGEAIVSTKKGKLNLKDVKWSRAEKEFVGGRKTYF